MFKKYTESNHKHQTVMNDHPIRAKKLLRPPSYSIFHGEFESNVKIALSLIIIKFVRQLENIGTLLLFLNLFT